MRVNWTFLDENELTSSVEAEIRALLVAAFPQHAEFFAAHSFKGSPPEFRLFARNQTGALVAHLECGRREITVGADTVRILGIGAVAVDPNTQGQGVGKAMFDALREEALDRELAEFGFLECREAVAGFYQKAGFQRVAQACVSLDPDTGKWDTFRGPVMVLALLKPVVGWPSGDEVHLRGMSW